MPARARAHGAPVRIPSGGNLGNQAGVNDIGSSSGSRAGSFDQAQADADQDQDQDQDDGDYDAMDMDSDDSDLA